MKSNSLRSTYGNRSILYKYPSHLRIRCRTLTRVLGGILQWAFFRPCCGRYVADSAPGVAAPLRSVLTSSVVAKSTSLIRSCRSVVSSSSLLTPPRSGLPLLNFKFWSYNVISFVLGRTFRIQSPKNCYSWGFTI